jgi:WhiB family redox-sensing transcriptional regulator
MKEILATAAINLDVRFPDFPDAACADPDVDPEVFFPKAGGGWDADVAYAVGICRGCPEQLACLTWAIEHQERGVWGGTSGPDRKSMKAGRPALVCSVCRRGFSDPGKPGPKPKRCATCRSRQRSERG